VSETSALDYVSLTTKYMAGISIIITRDCISAWLTW